jgi:hypothetical protein
MRARQLVTFLLGAWITGSLFMTAVATQNFRNVDRLLAAPSDQAGKMIQALTHDSARQLLRYHSSELNRLYFVWWEAAQLLVGAALLIALARAKCGTTCVVLAAVALVITVSMHWLLTPQVVSLGRLIDFLPQGVETPVRSQFWKLHGIYSTLEVVKMALLLVISGVFVFQKESLNRRAAS